MVLNSINYQSDKDLEGLYSAAFTYMYQTLLMFQSRIDPTGCSHIINWLRIYSLT